MFGKVNVKLKCSERRASLSSSITPFKSIFCFDAAAWVLNHSVVFLHVCVYLLKSILFAFSILLYISPAKTQWGSFFAVPAGEHWGMPKVINCVQLNLIHMLCSVVVIPWVALMPRLLNMATRVYSLHCLSLLLCVHIASSLLNESLLYMTAVGG